MIQINLFFIMILLEEPQISENNNIKSTSQIENGYIQCIYSGFLGH